MIKQDRNKESGWRTMVTRNDRKAVRIEDVVNIGDKLVDLMKRTAQDFDALPSDGRRPTTSEFEE